MSTSLIEQKDKLHEECRAKQLFAPTEQRVDIPLVARDQLQGKAPEPLVSSSQKMNNQDESATSAELQYDDCGLHPRTPMDVGWGLPTSGTKRLLTWKRLKNL